MRHFPSKQRRQRPSLARLFEIGNDMKTSTGWQKHFLLYLFLSGAMGFLCGCSRGGPDGGDARGAGGSTAGPLESRRKGPDRTVTDYHLKGVVKKVEFERVRIAHEAIPGFMDAMLMPFPYKDNEFLKTLKIGDVVEGTLRVVKEDGVVADYDLRDLEVTLPAAPRMVLDVSKGKASLRPEPKRLEVGQAVPDFSMTTQDGKQVKLSDLRGNVIVLTFIYTRCPLPDFCPLMDRKFSELAQRIGAIPERALRIRLISLSFDPEHDTPEVLAKHARIRGAAPPLWSFAVAAHEELAKIAGPLGLFYDPHTNEIAHNLCTAIIDSEGKLARLEVGTTRNKWENVDLLKSIYSLIPAARSSRSG
jgi:protein SCO1/2